MEEVDKKAHRTDIYIKYKKYAQKKDTRSMEQICTSHEGFKLQVQQKFLKEYLTTHDWKYFLMYGLIGSGKTCTAITIVEEWMRLHPKYKVNVVLPARLRTNMIDELISPCGYNKYISQKDHETYYDAETTLNKKKQIKETFMSAIEKKYDIMSFEKFKKNVTTFKSLKAWVREFTKNRIIIIDEVHNLINSGYDHKIIKEIFSTHMLKKTANMGTVLLRYLTTFAHPSCRVIMMTATPVFDNSRQLRELIEIMNPGVEIPKKSRISEFINILRGKVSFFPGTSDNAYPKKTYVQHVIPITPTLDKEIYRLSLLEGSEGEEKEAFMSKQRQASIACLPDPEKASKDIPKVLSNIKEYSPKIYKLMKNIKKLQGKHIVYSGFVQIGVNIVEARLKEMGWVNYTKLTKEERAKSTHAYKVYAVWDGSTKDSEKEFIKSVMNKKDNMDGKIIRVVIGSPSMKEGVSFKHIQHVHLMDTMWNHSGKDQVEGRAIRFCSHIDIPLNHPVLKRKVQIHIYKLKSHKGKGWFVEETPDEYIYNKLIVRKEKLIKSGETALKKVAIDYFLFRRMYAVTELPSPKPRIPKTNSLISIGPLDDVSLGAKKNGEKKTKTTCPSKRRPDKNDKCPSGFFAKLNKNNDLCCYKIKPVVLKTTCPKPRLPDADGKCSDGYIAKLNKHNDLCCYKNYIKTK